ncbi:hypothetical protein NMG60_11002301 [Bertholletia excelsa]
MGKRSLYDKNGLKKGPWTAEEDQKLIECMQKHGQGRWRAVPQEAGLKRCGKSCRLRWTNYLRPDIKRGRFSFEEEETIIQLHRILGNKWSAIAAHLPGRTDNEIKNYWNTRIRKRFLRMGIDPVTHSPRLDLLERTSILTSYLFNSSSQLNLQSDPDTQALLTSRLSSQCKNMQFLPQNHQETLLSNHNLQNQFQNDNIIQEFQSQMDLGASMNDTQFMKLPNVEDQISPNITHFSCQNSVASLPASEYSNQSFNQLFSEDQMFQHRSNNRSHKLEFGSLLSAASSSSISLHSCTTYIAEDEKESYYSNKMFEIPINLGIHGLM